VGLEIADCKLQIADGMRKKYFCRPAGLLNSICNLQFAICDTKKIPGIHPGTFEYSAKKIISS
jgi:hypothetical protein